MPNPLSKGDPGQGRSDVECVDCDTVTLGTCVGCGSPLCSECADEDGECETCAEERESDDELNGDDDDDADDDDDGDEEEGDA